MSKRFQLRHAAGVYWLLDMEQEIGEYKKPLIMNETGAEIFKLLEEGKNEDEITKILADRYSSKPDDVQRDIAGFEMHLREFGFTPENPKEAL
ncbi:MAG: PqqD family protein [Lachnospiraceae bacterium]|nr:PqqD family protein [Lachnospiraceae bacterium]